MDVACCQRYAWGLLAMEGPVEFGQIGADCTAAPHQAFLPPSQGGTTP
jgi:hypothetical protein